MGGLLRADAEGLTTRRGDTVGESVGSSIARPRAVPGERGNVRARDLDWQRVASIATITLVIAAVAATLVRLLFGVDFIDEAFYAATALRFAKGARPFIDDWDVHQTAALLVAPYVRLHLAVIGDTTGLLLGLRLLWALLNGTAVVLMWQVLRRYVDWRVAAISSACAFVVMPYMIPAPSFNTLAVVFGSIGASLCVLGCEGNRRPLLVLAGVSLGLAVFAYPTFVVAALGAVVGCMWLSRSGRAAVWVLVGGAVTAVAGASLLLPHISGLGDVLTMTQLGSQMLKWVGSSGQLGGKLGWVADRLLGGEIRRVGLWIAVAIAVLQVLRRRVPIALSAACILALPFTAGPAQTLPGVATLEIAQAALVSAAVVAFSSPAAVLGEYRRPAFFLLGFGLVASAAIAATSSLGAAFFGLGALAVMPAALSVLLVRVGSSTREDGRPALALALGAACTAVVLVWMLGVNAGITYHDGSPGALDTMVRSGPHAGLLTTQSTARDIEALNGALARLSGPDDTLFAYHGLPAAYLMSEAKAASPLLWTMALDECGMPKGTAMLLDRLDRPGELPTVVVKNLSWPDYYTMRFTARTDYDPARDGVERWVRAHYRIAASGQAWQVLTLER